MGATEACAITTVRDLAVSYVQWLFADKPSKLGLMPLRKTAYAQFDQMVAELNESMGLCIK